MVPIYSLDSVSVLLLLSAQILFVVGVRENNVTAETVLHGGGLVLETSGNSCLWSMSEA